MKQSLEELLDEMQFDVPRGLVSRAMAAATAGTEASNVRARTRFTQRSRVFDESRMMAAVAILLAAAIVAALIAISQSTHHAVPAGQSHLRPGTVWKNTLGLSVFSAQDAAVWGPYNSSSSTGDSLDSSGVLVTHDGGKTWLASGIQSNVPDLESVSWTDSQHIAIVDTNYVHVTSDGGVTWREIERRLPPGGSLGVAPILRISGSTMFWIPDSTQPSPLSVSRDSGLTWTTAVLPAPPGAWPGGIWYEDAGPYVFGDLGVFAVSSLGTESTWIYTSSDSGLHWSGPIAAVSGTLTAVTAHDWWIVGQTGNVFHTVDAGKSWDVLPISPDTMYGTLLALFPVGGNVIWGLARASSGMGGPALPIRSPDGGMHWSVVRLPA